MLFKKLKNCGLQLAVLLLAAAFAFIMVGACKPDDDIGGLKDDDDEIVEQAIDISNLTWGISDQANVLTLGLQPGNDTTEININWYSSGTPSDKVTQVRFIRGTLTEAYEVLTQDETVNYARVSTASAGNTQHKARIKGLKPGANYVYAVTSDGMNWSETYDFKVPSSTSVFKFAVIADPQLHASTWDNLNRYTPTAANIVTGSTSKTGQGWIETMQKIVAAGVSIIVSGGDQVDASGGNENEYNLLFAPPGLRSLPLAPVSGNHDNHLNFNYHYNLPNQQEFSGETTATAQRRNYFYLYNNILFVGLDTAPYPTSTSEAGPYVDRYKSTLTAAKLKFAGKYDWLIVHHHKSTASVADHLADRDIQYYVEAGFEKVMSDQGVDFVLAGHDHVYARSYPLSGRDGGKVSVPNKSFNAASGSTWNNPGDPIYLTFTTGSGLKYYAVAADTTSVYANTLYVKDNTAYPYLGDIATGDTSTNFGSTDYLTGNYLPVSNAAYVQPYIPSYSIVEVNGKTITFKTYAIATANGQVNGAAEGYDFDENVPYDVITVTKN